MAGAVLTGHGAVLAQEAPSEQAPSADTVSDWEVLGAPCLFMWILIWPPGPKVK